MAAPPDDPSFRSAYFDRYDEYQADLVVEILNGAGIRAFTKVRRTDPHFSEYGRWTTDLGVVMVDAARIDEARQVVEAGLPEQLAAIAREMDSMEMGPDQEDVGGDGDR